MSQWSAPNLPDGRSSNIPKHVKNLDIIYIIYIINIFIYLYIYLWFLEWARGVFLRDFSQKWALFWSFLMIFDFQWPPLTTPMLWINSLYFIGLSSSRWTTFILVWYMSEIILGVKSQLRKKRANLKFGNPFCKHPVDHISKFQIGSFLRSWDMTFKMTPDMYQTNIKVVPLIE